jgi:septin family protein
MPPLSFDFHHGESDSRAATGTVGFTSSLMNTIVVSRSKMQQWAEFEKAKADKVAESYRLKLLEEQASIDAQTADLLSVQLERGLKVVDGDESQECNDIQEDNIVSKKHDLEEEKASLQAEISRLEQDFENREKRVSGEKSTDDKLV